MEKSILNDFEKWIESKIKEVVETEKNKENLNEMIQKFDLYVNSYKFINKYEEESKILQKYYESKGVKKVVELDSQNKYVGDFQKEIFLWSKEHNASEDEAFATIWQLSKFLDNYDENTEVLNRYHLAERNNQEVDINEVFGKKNKRSTYTEQDDSYGNNR